MRAQCRSCIYYEAYYKKITDRLFITVMKGNCIYKRAIVNEYQECCEVFVSKDPMEKRYES